MSHTSPQDSRQGHGATRALPHDRVGMAREATGHAGSTTVVHADSTAAGHPAMPQSPRRARTAVPRGITARMATTTLRQRIRVRALSTLNRFRVLRTLDVAVACFPERGFKASLSAAQRAVRAMVKARHLRRYRTDRFQTIYGLTTAGANWLDEHGVDGATSSVRRVADMLNPEHQLWAQFLVLCCEARGLKARSENELLQDLAQRTTPDGKPLRGLLTVSVDTRSGTEIRHLRPDLVAQERDGSCVWFEVDRSKRGSDREASLRALIRAMGYRLENGQVLRRIVIFVRDRRVQLRALTVLNALAEAQRGQVLYGDRRQVRPLAEPGQFAVWGAIPVSDQPGRSRLEDRMVGRVQVQLLPSWLPKVRMDGSNRSGTAGWLEENYLPYARFSDEPAWQALRSPLE